MIVVVVVSQEEIKVNNQQLISIYVDQNTMNFFVFDA